VVRYFRKMSQLPFTEADVHITEFIAPKVSGFHGVLKHFASDFHVREVNKSGKIMYLNELWTKARAREEILEENNAKKELKKTMGEDFILGDDDKNLLQAHFNEDQITKLIIFFKDNKQSNIDVNVKAPEDPSDVKAVKASRGKGHGAIRDLSVGELLSSESHPEGGAQTIRIWRRDKELAEKSRPQKKERPGKRERGKGKGKGKGDDEKKDTYRLTQWPADRPNFLLFKLYKENRETQQAIQTIAKATGLAPKLFSFAGTKDKRGYTTQLCTVNRVTAEKLRRGVAHPNWDWCVRVEPIDYVPEILRLGDLSGNHFEVLLRDIDPSEENKKKVIDALNSWKEGGYLNYFGCQRFGTQGRIRTHHVGAAILRKEFETAVALILGDDSSLFPENPLKKQKIDLDDPRAHHIERKKKLVEAFQEGDYNTAFQQTAHFNFLEQSLLQSLIAKPKDFHDALTKLPRNSLSMYLHAVQSYTFNYVLSQRIKETGAVFQEGDFVLPPEAQDDDEEEDAATDARSNAFSRVITDAKADAGYKFTDVVLPLPGTDVKYPPKTKELYTKAAQDIGIDLADLAACSIFKLCGAYRRVAILPTNVDWEIIEPETMASKFSHIASDIDRINSKEKENKEKDDNKTETEKKENEDEKMEGENIQKDEDITMKTEEDVKKEKKKEDPFPGRAGIRVSVTLPASAYVTMALREVMKTVL